MRALPTGNGHQNCSCPRSQVAGRRVLRNRPKLHFKLCALLHHPGEPIIIAAQQDHQLLVQLSFMLRPLPITSTKRYIPRCSIPTIGDRKNHPKFQPSRSPSKPSEILPITSLVDHKPSLLRDRPYTLARHEPEREGVRAMPRAVRVREMKRRHETLPCWKRPSYQLYRQNDACILSSGFTRASTGSLRPSPPPPPPLQGVESLGTRIRIVAHARRPVCNSIRWNLTQRRRYP